jgi:predicted type IV restriction endonuclease/predicted transport protein
MAGMLWLLVARPAQKVSQLAGARGSVPDRRPTTKAAGTPASGRHTICLVMSLATTVEKALQTAAKLKASGGNEANTKALLIEPMLSALGWDTTDVDQVERECRVYDKTSLDYALRLNGELKLFVEAKAVGKSLEDKAFISQTVNYANNEGVIWCVLSNGLAWRVYKTNEPVGMQDKLLFEMDLTEGSTGDVARQLQLLSRDSLGKGDLEAWGERVFTDNRVRHALGALAAKPPPELLSLLKRELGKPEVSAERLQESLARIIDVETPVGAPNVPPGPKKLPDKPPPTPKKELPLDHHLGGKPAAMVDLFEQADEFGRGLGADVSRRVRKYYIGYYAGRRSFLTIEVQRQRLILYVNLDPTATTPWNDDVMRDVRGIGHYGMGDTEYSFRTSAQLEEAKALIKQAYEKTP